MTFSPLNILFLHKNESKLESSEELMPRESKEESSIHNYIYVGTRQLNKSYF